MCTHGILRLRAVLWAAMLLAGASSADDVYRSPVFAPSTIEEDSLWVIKTVQKGLGPGEHVQGAVRIPKANLGRYSLGWLVECVHSDDGSVVHRYAVSFSTGLRNFEECEAAYSFDTDSSGSTIQLQGPLEIGIANFAVREVRPQLRPGERITAIKISSGSAATRPATDRNNAWLRDGRVDLVDVWVRVGKKATGRVFTVSVAGVRCVVEKVAKGRY